MTTEVTLTTLLLLMNCSPCPQVTQPGAGVVLALAGPESGELVAVELEMQLRNLMGTMSRLVRERDLEAQVGNRQQSHGAEQADGVWSQS